MIDKKLLSEYKEIVKEYLPHWKLDDFWLATTYIQYVKKDGEEGIKDLIGFVQFCKTTEDLEDSIAGTLAHEINGVNDDMLLPRTATYGKYYKN